MLAAVLHQINEPLSIDNVRLDPPGPGEVLIKVEAAGICHTDQHYMSGDLSCLLPAVVGHEGAGRIEAVGSEVTRFSPGQRVCMTWRPRCGECRYCVTGQPAMCERAVVQSTRGGLLDGTSRLHGRSTTIHHLLGVSCFAQYAVVSERAVVAVPEDIPAEIAAIAGCAVITGVGAVLTVIGACAGRSIAIFGAGGVGLSAVMGAKLSGAGHIIVIDVVPDRLEMARTLGATAVINAAEVDPGTELASLVPGGLDFAIEAVGRADTLVAAFVCLRPRGTVVAVGLGRQDAVVTIPLNQLVQREKRVLGSLYGSSNPTVDLPRLFDLYRAGQLPLEMLLGRRYRLDQVNQAYADLATGSVGRGVLLPWEI